MGGAALSQKARELAARRRRLVVSVGAQRGGHRPHAGWVNAVTPLAGDGDVLVSGGADRAVKLWRRARRPPPKPARAEGAAGLALVSTLERHADYVTRLAAPRRRQAGARFSAPAWARTRCSCGTPLGAPRRTEGPRTRPSRARRVDGLGVRAGGGRDVRRLGDRRREGCRAAGTRAARAPLSAQRARRHRAVRASMDPTAPLPDGSPAAPCACGTWGRAGACRRWRGRTDARYGVWRRTGAGSRWSPGRRRRRVRHGPRAKTLAAAVRNRRPPSCAARRGGGRGESRERRRGSRGDGVGRPPERTSRGGPRASPTTSPRAIPSSAPRGRLVPARARAAREPLPSHRRRRLVRGGDVPGCLPRERTPRLSRRVGRVCSGNGRETFRDSPLAMRRSWARRPWWRTRSSGPPPRLARDAGGLALWTSPRSEWSGDGRRRFAGPASGALRGDAGDPKTRRARCRCRRGSPRTRARLARRHARSERRVPGGGVRARARARGRGEETKNSACRRCTRCSAAGRRRDSAAGARDPNGDVGDDVDTLAVTSERSVDACGPCDDARAFATPDRSPPRSC